MGAEPMRVLIADDEPLARERLRAMLAAQPGVEVVGEVGDGHAALHACAEHHPDIDLPLQTSANRPASPLARLMQRISRN